jgi:hypothetical protein
MEKKKSKKLVEEKPENIYANEKFNSNFCPLVTYLPTNRALLSLMRGTIISRDLNI